VIIEEINKRVMVFLKNNKQIQEKQAFVITMPQNYFISLKIKLLDKCVKN
jgi:hypothetical protein